MNLWKEIQQWAGVPVDGIPGDMTAKGIALKVGLLQPFDLESFLARFTNLNAPAITDLDITLAAEALDVSIKHIQAIKKIESNGKSFGPEGRPIILFEPHIFYRRTSGRFGTTSFSYKTWNRSLYPKTQELRWLQMAHAAECDEQAALESASWGLFQIMGFHWKALGYSSAGRFAELMAVSEGEHLKALVKFIQVNGLAPALRRCKAGDPDSCRDFVEGYNGTGYEANNYHVKFAEALK